MELARGFGLTEGGLWVADGNSGYWIFTGLLDNVLYKVTPQKQVSVFMEKAGYTGNDPEHVGAQTRSGRSHVLLIGPSCTGMDHQGRIVWCADNDRQVMRSFSRIGLRASRSGSELTPTRANGLPSSFFTSDRSCGYMARHGGHQFPQKSSKTTFPR